MKKIEKLAMKTVNTIIGIETYGWPPVCFGVIYQPPRPKKRPVKSGYDKNKQPSFK